MLTSESGMSRVMPSGAQEMYQEVRRSSRAAVHGIVLAGVHAWGNCILDEVVCRPLLPLVGRPLVCHALQWLRRGGVLTATVCANSDTGSMYRALGSGREMGMQLDYYEDSMPRGPAGSVRDAADLRATKVFVVIHGTVVPRFDLERILATHLSAGTCATVVARRCGHLAGCDSKLEPAGIYVFSPEAIESIPARGYQDIKETMLRKLHAQDRRVAIYSVKAGDVGRVLDSATYASVCRTELVWMEHNGGPGPEYRRVGSAWIHPSARVHSTARLLGPVLVQAGCQVDAEALIVGPTVLGERSILGPRAVVSRSTLWDQCRINADATVDNCVLTDGSVVESGGDARGVIQVRKAYTELAGDGLENTEAEQPNGSWLPDWSRRGGLHPSPWPSRRRGWRDAQTVARGTGWARDSMPAQRA